MMDINPCPNPECPRKVPPWVSWGRNCARQVICYCGYNGPAAKKDSESIRLHNLISPQPSAPVQPNPIGANMLPHGSPFAVPVQPVVTAYAIIYEDPDRQHEVFMGDDAAVSATKRFALISDRWNAHLFERVPFGDNTVEGFVVPASPSAQPQPEEAACPRCKQLREAYETANFHLSCALEVISKQLKERTDG